MKARAAPERRGWVDFKAVKKASRFEPILAHYNLKLAREGTNLAGHCPFHEDDRPSFKVHLEKAGGVFHCFGCGAKGNVIDFVQRMDGTSLVQAARRVAELCGIPISGEAPTESSRSTAADVDDQATRPATTSEAVTEPEENRPLTFTLKLDPEHPYLRDRGLTPETIAYFGLGYSNRGLLRGRIAIPIHNDAGELVAYAGRFVGPEDELSEGEGKYKLPPKFHKGRVLFNLNRIPRWAAERVEEAILVEGYFQTFWLHQNGYPNVVSFMGSSLSSEQRRHLVERFDRVRIFLDGDDAGEKATGAIALELAGAIYVKTVACPRGLQPDQLSAGDLKTLLR